VLPAMSLNLRYARKDGLARNAGQPDAATAAIAGRLAIVSPIVGALSRSTSARKANDANPGRRHGGQMRFLQTPAANDPGARSRTAQAVLFLMAPTIAVRTAPATPPPATWPTMLPISGVEALLASNGISIPRSCPPA